MADPRAILVRNEQEKLTATYINGLAIALAAVGAIAPVIAAIQGTGANAATAALTVACLVVSGSIHLAAPVEGVAAPMNENPYFYILLGPVCIFLTAMIVLWLTRPSAHDGAGE